MPLSFIRYNNDKFQRLGLIKTLVAILDPQRRSVATEALNRKLLQLLFEVNDNKIFHAELLLRSSSCESWNLSITKRNVGQILEWGKLYGFIGAGNQITESGLILRSFMGVDAVSSISSGDFEINPFSLTLEEKLYFLYRQFEIDTTIFFLLKRLTQFSTESPIRGIDADKLTCFALFDTYNSIKNGPRGLAQDFLTFRNLRSLIGQMAFELRLSAEVPIQPPTRLAPRAHLMKKPGQQKKKRTKTADHEAISRFELLVDLGVLTKKSDGKKIDGIEKSRKAWRYWVTPLFLRFARNLPVELEPRFNWYKFAHSCSVFIHSKDDNLNSDISPQTLARRSYSTYREIERRFGHTPFESVAVITMIRSLAQSEIIEIKDIHDLFLSFKLKGIFSETVRFASGNDIDKMFIYIKPTFLDEVNYYYGIES